jgi:hypothetical protein
VVIERTFVVSPSNSLIFPITDNAGNSGKELNFVVDTTSFVLNSGDIINTHILFDTPLRITDINNGFWQDNWEPTNFIYWLASDSSATANVSYSISFDIASGTPAINPLIGNLSDSGDSITAARTLSDSNITDSSVVINGLTIQSNISNYTLDSGTGEFTRFEGILQASDITFVSLVAIDIKPGSDPNSVNPRSKGVIPVAVLGSIDFDSTQFNFTKVTFGLDGASPAHDGHVEDVNNDGFMDAVFHFKTQKTGIACDDLDATLVGEISDGTKFTGTDTVKTVGCKDPKQDTSVSTKGAGAMSWIFLIGLSVLGLWRRDR